LAGGASEWHNGYCSPDALTLCRYDSSGFEVLESVDSASMGDPQTLTWFLDYGLQNYPADKTAAIIWNHGGGSVSGVAFDENYEDDQLTLYELYNTFSAFDNVGAEALRQAGESSSFFGEFERAVKSAESYGGNNESTGYTNMVDLGDLARQASDLLSKSGDPLLSVLDQAVYYKINGPYRSQSSGISCFSTLDGDYDNYMVFASLNTSYAFTYYYAYELTGKPLDGMYEFLSNYNTEYWDNWDNWEAPSVETPDKTDFEDFPVTIENGDTAVLNLGSELAKQLAAVYFNIAVYDEDSGEYLFLGMDGDVNTDWENGVFSDNFIGEWCAIDGALLYMEVTGETDDYILFDSPIKLNGEEYTLVIGYDFSDNKYKILGARKEMNDSGKASKNLRKLKAGDVIEPILFVISADDYRETAADKITVTSGTSVEKTDVGDGEYLFLYEMWDYRNNSYLSQAVYFGIKNGEITLKD